MSAEVRTNTAQQQRKGCQLLPANRTGLTWFSILQLWGTSHPISMKAHGWQGIKAGFWVGWEKRRPHQHAFTQANQGQKSAEHHAPRMALVHLSLCLACTSTCTAAELLGKASSGHIQRPLVSSGPSGQGSLLNCGPTVHLKPSD